MRIAIDTTPLSSGHAERGVGVYTKHLIDSLKQYESKYSYTLFTRGQKVPENVDLVHYPYFDPFFLTLPLLKPKPTIVTVHDLIPLVFPDKFPPGMRGQLKWQIQKTSLLGAARILTDSKNSKNDIAKITGFLQDAIDVVHLAPSDAFQHDIGIKEAAKVKKKYALPGRYVTYVGDVNWNKNVAGLLQAFHVIQKTTSYKDIRLILIGRAFLDGTLVETQQINREIKELYLDSSVIFPGYVSDRELAGMYAGALCCVQPSLYEGFGFPVLEAMACGCPVVCSQNSSLPEIAGPSIRIQSTSTDSIVTGIKTCVDLPEKERNTLIAEGMAWAAKFTWKKVAHETVQAYERIHI